MARRARHLPLDTIAILCDTDDRQHRRIKRGDQVNYPGGKNAPGVYQTIINQMPPHSMYIEPFLGSGAVLRHKRPAFAGSIAIDIDEHVLIAFSGENGHIPDLTVICGDAISWLDGAIATLSDDTMIYLDPPYLKSIRRSQRDLYKFEMTDLEHRQLLRCLRSLTCRVIISGYYSDLYASELRDWRTLTYQTRTRGGSTATEWLWMNYPQPFELHDYRYLGDDFRQRERIKRQQIRWQDRLERMDSTQRYAMLEVIERFRSTIAIPGEGGHPRQL
jgi:hypothetical protein